MLFVVIAMILIVLVAAVVVVFAAYPHRGEDLPMLPALGEAMARAAEAAPVLEPEDAEDHRFVTSPDDGRRAGGHGSLPRT